MRVELSRALSVLSHEMRGPLGVLQGYLRMLSDGGVTDAAAVARMYRAMQDAATRLSAYAREASELSAWCEGRFGEKSKPVTLQVLLDAAAAKAGGDPAVAVRLPAESADVPIATHQPAALAAALAALVAAARREAPGQPIEMRVAADGTGNAVDVTIAPGTTSGSASGREPFDFDRGGLGLTLVLASHVLEAEGVDIVADREGCEVITARLQRDGGVP